ncbi:MAG: DHH family phosphoesterase [Armatimonadota bacterium]
MRADLVQKSRRLIDEGCSFVVTSHVNPEGDAIGSVIAMGLVLEGLGKRVCMLMQDPLPVIYRFLPGVDKVVRPPVAGEFDTAVVVDCEGLSRVGTAVDAVKTASRLLVIDHHPAERSFGDVEIRDPTAAAVGELIYLLLREWGLPVVPDVAVCLLAAILVDTGAFRYSNVTPRTLRVAADLVEHGANMERIISEVFESRPQSSIRLMGRALAAMKATEDGAITYATLSRGDFVAAGAAENETDGIVNQLLFASGAKAAMLFRESDEGVRVSLRSREGIDVSRVAREFGGGGHVRASGCTVQAPLDEAVRLVLEETRRQLGSASTCSGCEADEVS